MDRGTFEKLALEHIDAVHRMAMQLSRREQDAADLVQETYLRALRAAPEFEEKGGGIRAWLLTILHNAFFTAQSRQKKRPTLVEEFFEADDRLPPPDEAPPAWDLKSLNWEYVDQRLKQGIERLSPEHREVLLLWGVEGLKYKEIASIVGVPIGTVMSRLHRARATLAGMLKEMTVERGWEKQEPGSPGSGVSPKAGEAGPGGAREVKVN